MNEKEMIEEMAKDLKECLPNNWYWQKSVDSDTYFVAKHFYNTGYRKIPKDSVVLDKHEHQNYCAYKIIEPQIKGCLDRERELKKQVAELEKQRDRQAYIAEELIQEKHRWTEQARKEAVKQALQELYEQIDEKTSKWVKVQIEMIAKRNGVEVENENGSNKKT